MPLQDANPTPSFGGFGIKLNQPVQLETQPHWTTDVRSVTSALASLVKAGETFEAAAERLGLDAG